MCVGHSEVLEVDHSVGEQISTVGDEAINEFVVVLAPKSGTFPSHVERVGEEGVVVCPNIEDNG